MSGPVQPPVSGLSAAASISHRVVQLMSTYTGRGPTKAWTSIDHDLVSVVLRDTLTRGERSLVADGRSELVRSMRKAYQDTMRQELIAAVEEQTGRKVTAFLSDNHIDPDIAIESFVLEPRPEPDHASGGPHGHAAPAAPA
jgi:uncharacterized protein YbcI